MGSTSVLLIGWRAILYKVFPVNNSKKNDVYRRGNPFELFEVQKLLLYQHPKFSVTINAIPYHECFFANSLFSILNLILNWSYVMSWVVTLTVELHFSKMLVGLGFS